MNTPTTTLTPKSYLYHYGPLTIESEDPNLTEEQIEQRFALDDAQKHELARVLTLATQLGQLEAEFLPTVMQDPFYLALFFSDLRSLKPLLLADILAERGLPAGACDFIVAHLPARVVNWAMNRVLESRAL